MLLDSLEFAKQFTEVSKEDIEVIMHSCKTILNYNNEVWVKKGGNGSFDVPMGSLHGAEICELVGLHLLENLKHILQKDGYGLYRDDGLIVIQKSKCEMERLSKKIRSVFAANGFGITIESGLKRVEFLDVVLDLGIDSYRPYRKPNSETVYMSKQSNHPKYVKKQIPTMVNKRLNNLSKHESEFDFVKQHYENALRNSGYTEDLRYSKTANAKVGKKRRRKIIYFQPPFSEQIKTPIGKLFLRLVKKHFHPGHPLYKILNYRCLKISYCCLNSIKSEIAGHNKTILSNNKEDKDNRLCNCRRKDECPLNGRCLTSNVVYQADISTKEGDHGTYIGTTGNSFKERHRGHKSSFKYSTKRNTTELSKFYWKMRDEGKSPEIKWSVIAEIKSGYSHRNGCTLCNTERYNIALADKKCLLNKRNERKRACPHYASIFF